VRMRAVRMHVWSMLWCCAMLCVAGGAWPEDLVAARACAGIAAKSARLACYDAAFATSSATRAQPGEVPAPGPAGPASPSAPAAAQFGDDGQLHRPPKADLPKRINSTVRNVATVGRGLYRLTLENGQIWQTRQADWMLEFKSSDAVTISRMVFNTYQISLAGQGRSVSVARIQ
jgi:hypothetical protein